MSIWDAGITGSGLAYYAIRPAAILMSRIMNIGRIGGVKQKKKNKPRVITISLPSEYKLPSSKANLWCYFKTQVHTNDQRGKQ